MGLRPGRAVRRLDGPANTRQAKRKMSKAFVRGVPGSKCHTFQTGNRKGRYAIKATLVSKERMNLRHNQLEAARVAANQYFDRNLGMENYFMRCYLYPHHIMRENALATGAGADRFQSGMSKAFGKPSGLAARVKPGSRIFGVWLPEGNEALVKEAFRRSANKLSAHTRVVIEPVKTRKKKKITVAAVK